MTPTDDINYSIALQQMQTAVDAVLLAPGGGHLHGYAVISGTKEEPEVTVSTFKTRDAMDRALSEVFDGNLLPGKFHTVYKFGPDRPPRMHALIEWDDDELEEVMYQRARLERDDA